MKFKKTRSEDFLLQQCSVHSINDPIIKKNFFWIVSFAAITLSLFLQFNVALAQDKKDEEKEEKPPEVQEIELETEDGVQMVASYYESLLEKKAAVAVLIHDFGGNKMDLDFLARVLQAQGFAVIVPDLRGHGKSTKIKPPGKNGVSVLRLNRFRTPQFKAMITEDMEAIRNFIISENDDGKLNMDKMCIVGSGNMGSVIAVKYSREDWRHEPLNGGVKTGQDVKAVALLSPHSVFRGVKITKADFELAKFSSMFTLVGENDKKAKKSADKFHKNLSFAHKRLKGDPEIVQLMTSLKIKLQGSKLLGVKKLYLKEIIDSKKPSKPIDVSKLNMRVETSILQFFHRRVRQSYKKSRWQKRESN